MFALMAVICLQVDPSRLAQCQQKTFATFHERELCRAALAPLLQQIAAAAAKSKKPLQFAQAACVPGAKI